MKCGIFTHLNLILKFGVWRGGPKLWCLHVFNTSHWPRFWPLVLLPWKKASCTWTRGYGAGLSHQSFVDEHVTPGRDGSLQQSVHHQCDTFMKSTQRTNFQSISYFASPFMKLTLIYVKVVKHFSLWHNFILDVPASSAQKLLPGKVPARINISRNGKYPQIHFLQYWNWFFFLKLCFIVFVSCFWKQFTLNFTTKKSKYERCLNLFCSEKLQARKTVSQNKLFTE